MMSKIKPNKQIRKKINITTRRIEKQSKKLDRASLILNEKDKRYYNKVVEAVQVRNKKKVALYVNELTEVRRTMKSIHQARLALEQILLRLSTVKDIGDIVVTLAPAIFVIRSIQGSISGILPQSEIEFHKLSNILSDIITDFRFMESIHVDVSTANSEAERILKQAEEQMKEEMKEKMSPVPYIAKEDLTI